MLQRLRLRWFTAEVAAELKAQYSDQRFVSDIMNLLETQRLLSEIMTGRSYSHRVQGESRRVVAFLATCEVLAQALDVPSVDYEDKLVAVMLLENRLERAAENDQHALELLALERKMKRWVSTFATR